MVRNADVRRVASLESFDCAVSAYRACCFAQDDI